MLNDQQKNESWHIIASVNVTIEMSYARAPEETVSCIPTNNFSNKDTLIDISTCFHTFIQSKGDLTIKTDCPHWSH